MVAGRLGFLSVCSLQTFLILACVLSMSHPSKFSPIIKRYLGNTWKDTSEQKAAVLLAPSRERDI